jgi:hypothetical protein
MAIANSAMAKVFNIVSGHSVKNATKRGCLVCNTYVPHSISDAARIFKANRGGADLDLNQHLLTLGGSRSAFTHLQRA